MISVDLARSVLRQGPFSVSATKVKWLDRHRDWFEYATHEVPSGVLYSHEGATVDECNYRGYLLDRRRYRSFAGS